MADNLDLAIRIRADLQSALNGLKQMEGGVAGVDREIRKASIGARIFRSTIGQLVSGDLIARGLTAIARSAQRFAVETVQAGIAAESLTLAMRAATGDAGAAAAELAFVDVEAARLGISLPIAEQAMVRLTAATRGTRLEGAATRDIFSALAETARALNLDDQALQGAFTAVEQIISKGVVSAEELRGQLGERIPRVVQILADALGVSTAELSKMLARGELLAEDVMPKLAAGLREVYGAGAVGAADGPAAAFTRLDNALVKVQRTLGETSGLIDTLAFAAAAATDILLDLNAALGGGKEFDLGKYQLLRAEYVETAATVERLRAEFDKSAQAALAQGIAIDNLRKRKLGQDLDEAERRLRIGADILREYAPHLPLPGGSVRPSRPPSSGSDSDTDTTQPSAAERAAKQLERQLIALRAVNVEERIRAEIQAGLITGDEAELERLLDKARALDQYNAEAERGREEAEAARRKELADEAEHRKKIEAEADALEELAALRADLAAEQAALAGPYQAAVQAAQAWRAEQERQLAALAAQGHATRSPRRHRRRRLPGQDRYGHPRGRGRRGRSRRSAAAHRHRLRLRHRARAGRSGGGVRGPGVRVRERGDRRVPRHGGCVGPVRLGGQGRLQRPRQLHGRRPRPPRHPPDDHPTAARLALQPDRRRYAVRQRQHPPRQPAQRPYRRHRRGAPTPYRTGIPAAAFAGAPRLHGGGIPGLAADEIPTILRRGEGVFTPEQMRALGPAAPPRSTSSS